MNLYALVTSDRAQKGQGGNKKIEIVLTVGSAKEQIPFGRIVLDNTEHAFVLSFQDRHTNIKQLDFLMKQKGNKQKGECNLTRAHDYSMCGKLH